MKKSWKSRKIDLENLENPLNIIFEKKWQPCPWGR
jgi:hypothetical protein